MKYIDYHKLCDFNKWKFRIIIVELIVIFKVSNNMFGHLNMYTFFILKLLVNEI